MIGARIGNFTVLRKIGDGGMGVVYEAVHEGIGRRAAIKVLHARYSQDPHLVTRFFNEARAVNIVQHPGIVGVFDFGQLPDGAAYIVMEYLDGEPLKTRMRRLGRLGPDALRLARQLAGTLAAAHGKGIVHRDLKPDNIVVVPDPEAPGGERAKVLDFGIAKIAVDSQDNPESHAMTQAGMVMGTPKYMSPEQCRGASNVDAKADVYSLGVMLFEMLGGRLPFEADGTGALLAMHIYKPPPPLRDLLPTVSPQEEALIQSMLAKDPAARPTMAEVAARLEQLGAKGTQALPIFVPSGPHSVPLPMGAAFSGPIVAPPPGQAAAGDNSRPSITAAGQAHAARRRQGRLGRVLVPGVVAAVVAAAALFAMRSSERGVTVVATQGQGAEARRVSFSITTEPAGAQVIRVVDGTVLGVTPWRMEQRLAAGQMAVAVRKDGYVERQLSIDLGRDFTQQVALQAVPEDPRPEVRPEPRPEPRSSSSRHRRRPKETKREREDEVEVEAIH